MHDESRGEYSHKLLLLPYCDKKTEKLNIKKEIQSNSSTVEEQLLIKSNVMLADTRHSLQ